MQHLQSLKHIAEMDTLIANPARLMIVYLLARCPKLSYLELMQATELSSGNITTHLQKLLKAGYISQQKSFQGNKPLTSYNLTESGASAYRKWGEQVIQALPEDNHQLVAGRLLHQATQKAYSQYREWYYDFVARYPFASQDKGLRLLPPVTEAFL